MTVDRKMCSEALILKGFLRAHRGSVASVHVRCWVGACAHSHALGTRDISLWWTFLIGNDGYPWGGAAEKQSLPLFFTPLFVYFSRCLFFNRFIHPEYQTYQPLIWLLIMKIYTNTHWHRDFSLATESDSLAVYLACNELITLPSAHIQFTYYHTCSKLHSLILSFDFLNSITTDVNEDELLTL